jgi:putative zinc finger protein
MLIAPISGKRTQAFTMTTKTCKHRNRDYSGRQFLLLGQHSSVHQTSATERTIYATSIRCLDCNKQLAIGRSGASVASEIRAAAIAQDATELGKEALNAFRTRRGFKGPLVTFEEMAGWSTNVLGESAHGMRGGEPGWLACQIYPVDQTHGAADTICEDRISFVDGELDEVDAEQFRLHLRGCEGCGAELPGDLQLGDRLSGLGPRAEIGGEKPEIGAEITIEPLPDVLTCSTCHDPISSADAIDAGWVCIDGRWRCADHRPATAPVITTLPRDVGRLSDHDEFEDEPTKIEDEPAHVDDPHPDVLIVESDAPEADEAGGAPFGDVAAEDEP